MGFVTLLIVFIIGVVISTLTFGFLRIFLLVLPAFFIVIYLFLLNPKYQDIVDKATLNLTVISEETVSPDDLIEEDEPENTQEEKPKQEKKKHNKKENK